MNDTTYTYWLHQQLEEQEILRGGREHKRKRPKIDAAYFADYARRNKELTPKEQEEHEDKRIEKHIAEQEAYKKKLRAV